MKLFVTGGTGFVGSHILRFALSRDHVVTALRREHSRPRIALPVQPDWLQADMDSICPEDMKGHDALIHLASAGVSPKKASWDEMIHWNVSSTMRLVQMAHAAGVKRMVVAGTFAEYGRAADRFDPIPADAPLLPTYGYASTKAAAFLLLHAYAIEHNLELVYLRIFSAYGEGQFEGNFWPALKAAAEAGADFEMTLGEQVRDYVPVETVAEQFVAAAESHAVAPGQPVVRNVGTGHPVSMQEFARYWWTHWKAKGLLRVGALPYRPNEVMRFVPEI